VREGCAPFHTPLPTLPFFFSLFLPLLFLILPVGEGKQTCMFPRDVAVHLLQVGMKVLLSSRFGARWRGDVLLQVLLSKLSSAAECCPSAAECCPEVAGCCRSCRCCCPSCQVLQSAVQVLQNAVQKLQVAAGAAGHMYVLLWRMVQVTCMCC
jgi:hypothetical protein